jgi:hypothetical protein
VASGTNIPAPSGRVEWPKSLAEIVRDKLDAAVLPVDRPVKLWAGLGTGELCTVCERPILPAQAEYEPQYDDGRPTIRLHMGCYGLWQTELIRRGYLRAYR